MHARDAAAHLRGGGAAPAQGAKPLQQGPATAALPRLQALRPRAASGQLASLDPEPALWGDGLLGTLTQTLNLGESGPGAAAARERVRQEAARQGREAEARRHAIAEREARAKALFAKCGPATKFLQPCMALQAFPYPYISCFRAYA